MSPIEGAFNLEVVEPHCRICQEPELRRCANTLLDWRGAPILKGRKKITYRTILSWLNEERPQEDRITYDSLWTHAKRHHELAGIVAYWAARMDKELREAMQALGSRDKG